jgi:hypothetical protein
MEGKTMEPNEASAALVVMEAGAPWPSYSRDFQSRVSSAVVESQPPSESLTEFSNRVMARLRRLRERGFSIPVAVFATSSRLDSEASDSRASVARAIVQTLVAQGGGELLIVADEGLVEEGRHELVVFAGALCDDFRDGNVNVRVRFGSNPSESGIRPMVEANRATLPDVRESWA